MLADTASLDKETVKVAGERDVLLGRIRQHVEGNARDAQDQETYGKEFDGLVAQLEAIEARLEKIVDERQTRAARKARILRFLEELRQADGLLMEFDETLWNAMVDTVTVYKDGEFKFAFKDGGKIRIGSDGK
ncbi:hypothetical protein FACS1894196_3300 [Clostridia bacterium]|nr:hypothetical protein FACS1894196_3300 [Clostridia bacterium]